MLDIFIVRMVAGTILITSIVVFYWISRNRISKEDRSAEPPTREDVQELLQMLWKSVAIYIPFISIILTVLSPEMIYETWFSLSFTGDEIVQIAGIVFYLLGAALLIFSKRHLGRFLVVDIMVSKEHQLITTGPYARIRHPIYTAVILLNISVVLFTLNFLLVLNLFAAIAIANYRATIEEALLSSQDAFGSEYKRYMMRTGRFLPKLR